jgi:hypothetical protein
VEAFSEKYLGLPTAVGRLTDEAFSYIEEGARAKMNGYAEKALSYPAKEVLIKSVIQAKPTFSMSCFLLSKSTCKKLVSLMAKFWWSGNLDKRSMHWLAWDRIAVPKGKGGMGFRDMQAFNVALLGKQGWRLMTHPNSLCAQVLKSRYYLNSEFMDATVPRTASRTWRAVVAGRAALQQGLIKRIGYGHTVSIWEDNWLPGARSLRPMGRLASANCDMVSELIDQGTYQWREEKLRENFMALDVDRTMQIPLRHQGGQIG